MEKSNIDFILASSSKGRQKVLSLAGYRFKVATNTVDDSQFNFDYYHDNISKHRAIKYAKQMARAKLEPFFDSSEITVAADTVGWCKRVILEKPITKEKCISNHQFISNSNVYFITGVAICKDGKVIIRHKTSKTKVQKLPPEIIEEISNDEKTLQASGYRYEGVIKNYISLKKSHVNNIMGICPKMLKKMLKKIK